MKAKTRKNIDMSMMWLLVIGGLNWGLTLFDINLVTWLADITTFNILSSIIYGAVGISALWTGVRMIGKKLMR